MNFAHLVQPARSRHHSSQRPGIATKATFDGLEPKQVSIILVSGKRFVPSFSREQDSYMLTSQLCYVIQGDSRRFADRLLHMPQIAGQPAQEFAGGYGHIVMGCAKSLSRERRKRPFIRALLPIKTDGKRTYLLVGVIRGKTGHGRVDLPTPPLKQITDRNIGDHVVLHGLGDDSDNWPRILKTSDKRLKGQVPILANR